MSLGSLPNCYLGGGESEWGEREIADTFTHGTCNAVLEFGGGAGSVSTIVQKHLVNKRNHVVIQPPDGTLGPNSGVQQLHRNKAACGSQFQVVDHILAAGEGGNIRKMVDRDFDCLVVDCEGCLVEEHRKNPDLFKSVKRIQVERDDSGTYDALFKSMTKVHTGKGCAGKCVTEVWDSRSGQGGLGL